MRRAFFDASAAATVAVFRRESLRPGTCIQGPAVFEEKTSTTVLYPGQQAEIDRYLNIEVTLSR
jgi:N-methylhydantoinase A